jgi:hypothetical protein
MPVQFTPPPDTRAVGTGDPANDMDNAVRALNASGAQFNVLNTAYAGGADPTGVSFSDAAWLACMDACTGTASVAPKEMIVPPGIYKLAGGLHINGPLRMRGLGASNYYSLVATGAPTTLPAVTINCAASNYLFNMPFQGYLWGGLEMSGLNINFTGTGNVFDSVNFADSAFRDMTVTLTASGSMAMVCSGSNSVLNVIHERCTFITTNATRTKPMFSIESSIGAGISNNTFLKCKFSNYGLDNTQFMVYFACTGAGSAYHVADNFTECWFEHAYGGVYRSLSGSNCKVDGCIAWDVQGGSPLLGNSLYYFGAFAGNSGSQGVQVTSCGRNLNGPDGTSTNKWDVECEATTAGVEIRNYYTTPLAGSPPSTYNVYYNFHGCTDVLVTSSQSPQGSAANGNSTTVISNPSPTQTVITQGTITGSAQAPGLFLPADAGFLEWNYDTCRIHNSSGATSGTIQAIRVIVRSALSVTNIVLYQAAAGAGLVTGNLVGLYTSAGVKIGASAEQSGVWNSGTSVFKTMALTGGPFLVAPGSYFVLAVSNQSAGSTPTWGFDQSFSATSANSGVGAGSQTRWATGSTAQTTLPASFTPSSYLTTAQVEYWAGLS